MESVLVMLYALFTMSTAQVDGKWYTGEGMDEMERQIETGDDIRVEIQSIRSNF